MEIEDLKELETQSIARGIPIIGSAKGKWLINFVKEHKPKRILELGTANGYSGIILGSEGAELTTIEKAEKIAEEATLNFHEHKTDAFVIIGDAVQIVKDLVKRNQQYDLIFIDFALRQYNVVLEDCISLLKSSGYLIADNINLEVQRNTEVKHCHDFKEAILNHTQLETELIDIKDGLSVSKKK